jgi:hypothetical protein
MPKKIIIPRQNLPYINAFTKTFQVRYRITTEDRNRFSAWSEIFQVPSNLIYDFNPNNINVSRVGSRFTVTWEPVIVRTSEKIIASLQEYDFWIQWSKGEEDAEWIYRERVLGNPVTLFAPPRYSLIDPITKVKTVIEEEPDQLSVEIYIPANPPIREGSVYEESGP